MHALLKEIEAIPTLTRFGRVARIEGLAVEVTGAAGAVSLGGQVQLSIGNRQENFLRSGRLPRRPRAGHAAGHAGRNHAWAPAPISTTGRPCIYPCTAWLGRVIDGFGEPMDGKGPLPQGTTAYPLKAPPPPAHRARPRRRQAGSGRARAQCLRHLLQGPAHGHFLRLRRRQIHAARHAGAQYQCRCHRDRPDRRTRPRSEGIHRGRSGRGRPGAPRRGRRDLRRSAAGAPPGRLCRHDGGRTAARPGPAMCCC